VAFTLTNLEVVQNVTFVLSETMEGPVRRTIFSHTQAGKVFMVDVASRAQSVLRGSGPRHGDDQRAPTRVPNWRPEGDSQDRHLPGVRCDITLLTPQL
jgi:hypothetical protein